MLRLAVPNVMNLLAFVGVIIFDGYFLGQIGTNALAGASLAFPFVMMVLHSSNSGMGAGVSSASFGLALGLVFACQGYGRGFGAMVANALRLCVNALGAVVAAYWLGFGLTGFCAAVAFGFVFYAALLCYNMQQIKDPIRPGAANDPK